MATPSFAAAPQDPIDVVESAIEVADGAASITVLNQTGVNLSVTGGIAGTGLFANAEPDPVGPGERAKIEIALGDRPLDEDDRFIVIVAPTAALPDGWSTSIPFSLGADQAAADPAVTKWRMVHYSGRGLRFEDSFQGRDLPLKNEGGCEAVALNGVVVGWVQGEGRVARVTATCFEQENGRVAARLQVSGLSSDGVDYTGTIDFDPNDDESTTVELTVRRTMKPSLFLSLLLIGIAFAYLARWWTGSGKAVKELQLRLAAIKAGITSAEATNPLTQFATITKNGGLLPVSKWNLRDALLEKLKEQKGALARAGRIWRPAGKATTRYRNAETALTQIEGILSKWPELANLLVRLRGLTGKLSALPKLRQGVLEDTLERSGNVIEIEDVEKIRAAAQLGVDVAEQWPAERAERVSFRYDELSESAADDQAFQEAKRDAVDAWTVYAGLTADATTANQVNDAAQALYTAEGKIEAALRLLPGRAFVGAVAEGAGPSAPTVHRDADINAEALEWSKRLRVTQWVVDSLLVLAVLLVAVLAGIQALYVDKAVGGLWDYAVIATWGFATVTVAEPIAAAIQRVADGLTSDSIPPPEK